MVIRHALIATAEMNRWYPEANRRVLLTRVADHLIHRIGELTPWMVKRGNP